MPTLARTTVALVAALAVAACSDPLVPPAGLPSALRAPDVSTAGWRLLERPGFSVRLPPGFEDLGLQPIDSDAAVFEKDGVSTLWYDHGIYSGPIRVPDGATEVFRDVRTRIGGRVATLVAFREGGEWLVGARWDGLGGHGPDEVALLVAGRTPLSGVRDEILAAIHSVRFR